MSSRRPADAAREEELAAAGRFCVAGGGARPSGTLQAIASAATLARERPRAPSVRREAPPAARGGEALVAGTKADAPLVSARRPADAARDESLAAAGFLCAAGGSAGQRGARGAIAPSGTFATQRPRAPATTTAGGGNVNERP